MKKRLKSLFRGAAAPLGAALARAGIPANLVTIAGVAVAVVAAYGFFAGRRWIAFIGLLLSGICDLADGAVAPVGPPREGAYAIVESGS